MNDADVPLIPDSQHLALLRAVFDNSPDLLYAVNRKLQVITCNRTFRKVVNRDHPEGLYLRELGFNADALAEHQVAFASQADAGHSWHQGMELRMNGRRYIDCTVISLPPLRAFHLRDHLAQPAGFKLDHAEDFHLVQDLFIQAAESNFNLIASVDRELRFTSFNAAYQEEIRRTYGHDIRVGDSVSEVFHRIPHHRDLLEHLFQRALHKEFIHHTLEVEDPSEPRLLNMRFYPLSNNSGDTVGVGQIILDVSEQMKAEAAIRESEQRFRALADNISQLVWIADATGQVVWFNQRWQEFTDMTPDEIAKRGWRRVIHPDHIKRVLERLQHSWDTGEVWEDVFPMKSKSGSYHWFLSRARPIRDSQGRIKHWFGTHTDITEQRSAEEALRQADHNKDRFLATLAHELRNPMAPLRSALETLRLSRNEQSGHALLYDMMNRQVDQLVRLVDDLLEVSRLTRGKIKLRKEQVRVSDIVSSALESTAPLMKKARHRLHVDVPDEELTLYGDGLRLAQVLINLLDNAAKYTDAGGDIWLRVSQSRRTGKPLLQISVTDNGRGIEHAALPYIFDSFVQPLRDDEPGGDGLGIGLSIVRSLVELHGGRIEARSQGLGRGSEFVVTLPLQQGESHDEAERSAIQKASITKARTLIVDDNVDAARSLGDLLTVLGNEVCVVHDGPAALAALDDFDPGLILLDIDMPGMDGYEVARRVRQRSGKKQRHLVALTGFGQEEDRRRAMAAGFDRHLVKPVDLATLQSLYTATRVAVQ